MNDRKYQMLMSKKEDRYVYPFIVFILAFLLTSLLIGCSTAKVKWVRIEQKYTEKDNTVVCVDNKLMREGLCPG